MMNESNEEKQDVSRSTTLSVTNIGGIDETEVTFQNGVTILAGRNATNRTSLLQGLMAALGSERVSLKADADEGHAALEFGDEIYRRTLERRNGTVVTDGDPYLKDPELADLFAFLLETNEARQAVARGDDLQELIMRPVDTDEIQAEIERLEGRKREIDDQLEELEQLETRLPDLEAKRKRVSDEIESLEDELETAQAELEEANVDVDERREEQSELEERLEDLRETRSELDRVRERIETERESIDALEDEREEVQERLESLSTGDDDDIGRIEAEIETLQEEKAELSGEISQLQSTIQFNNQLLEEGESVLPETDGGTDTESDGSITDQLVAEEETVTCWTCGSSVAREQIETTVDQLQKVRKERLEERSEISSELEERRETLSKINENRTEYRQTQRRLDSIDDEIERRHDRIDDLTADREELTTEIDDLEAEIDDLESPDQSDVLDQQKEVNQLEFELERKERERDEITDEIASIEERLEERSTLEARREDVTDELTDLRTRIDQIEETAVESFNEHMENLLEILEYENLDRIWIDRTTQEVREGRRKVTKSSFDLKIVRSTDSGAAYEDTITHLSESEREIIGLVFALAGYLVHDVYETLPFMLLDSLEAIDAERIATLLEYFESHVPYLVVALLHEDAQAVDEDTQITEI
ncbi:Kinetochore-Ndc80 complex, subunit Spc25 (plasmid) [Haloterrigena turkmenica DSM 5511]|uniref:Kinetochore-Ndc80 complex, subunit Spc25 n=1 Tax=Haloterrigena turkmenica (strain ATCC 51198 / DSM 5511 / JCM 9101 / NCIMB 13204 / VKM B-1734 / 4k) TaxID=543526 RepID=D2S0Q5_HALTV|nr:archaea-specific SMC-related protein [Haloterrigena turkmenica]ADB62952.1 Kinetochore-Ndc80 complex, subunit Spc25 [Haloterrigena turkmenica DSM 5511]